MSGTSTLAPGAVDFLGDGAAALIADPSCFIAGKPVEGSGGRLSKLNPTTGRMLGEFRAAGPEQVDQAVAAARATYLSGDWANASPERRSETLWKLVELVEQHSEELVEIVVADVGTPVKFAVPMQLEGALANFRWFAEAAKRGPDGWYERGMTADLPAPGDPMPASTGMLVREPIGVVAAITAYNFPFTLMAWKLGAALAAGCSCVVVPSPRAALSSLALWRLVEQLDLPEGTVSFLLGDAETGRRLTAHDGVDMVTFTGSVPVGAAVMKQAAPSLKRLVLELGGKSPNILLPGTDIAKAIPPSIVRLVSNAGQRCGATSRIFVHESDVEAFTEGAREFLDAAVVGDPRRKDTLVGPLVDAAHRDFVQGHLERAKAAGATVIAGGGEPAEAVDGGFFLAPQLLGGIDNSSEFCRQEQFGPVGAVLAYADVEDAIAQANETDFGLNANVMGPTEEAIRVARRIRSGTVTVNGGGRIRPDAPWGGYGFSGIGRESGDEGFREFFEIKHIQWPL